MSGRPMQRFWDARAKEDALFFVDDRLPYRAGDAEAFFARGEEDLDAVLSQAGARIAPDDVVVDVGCGVGRLTRVLAGRAQRVIGIDVSEQMLARARDLNAHLDNVEWVHGDGVSLAGIPDEAATAVVSHVVFQHIPDPDVTLGYVRDMGRVLRDGGWAAFGVSNDPGIHRARGGWKRRLQALAGRAPKGQDDPRWLGSAVDLDALRAAAAAGGCAVEQVAGAGTQFCLVRLRRQRRGPSAAPGSTTSAR